MSIDDSRSDVATLRRELRRRRLAERDLAERDLAERDLADSPASTRTAAPASSDPTALSAGQRRMWSLQQLDPGTAGYNVRIAVDLVGPVRVDALIAAVEAVVARHDILRTTYRMGPDGRVRQVVHPVLAPVVARRDLSDLPADGRSARAGELCGALAAAPFDLSVDSPLRVGLYSTAPDALTMIVVAHHIAWDDATTAIFFGELIAFYRDPAAPLPPARQYADVASSAPAGDTERGQQFWRAALDPLPEPLVLPELTGADRAAGGADQTRALRAGMAARVREVAREHGASTFMVLLAAVTDLLHRYSGARDLVIGVPVVNRDFPGGDQAIGYLGNTIALRLRPAADDSFATLLARAKQVSVAAYAHQDVDLDDVARSVDPDRTRGDAGLFSVVLSLRAPVLEPLRAVGLTATRRHVPGDAARFDLTLAVETDGDDLAVEANHPATPAAHTLVGGLLGHLDGLLAAVLADPDRPLRDVDLLGDDERDQLIGGWNGTAGPVAEHLLPELFAAQVAATPQAPAVLADGDALTYHQLDRRANRLARLLVARGVGPESTVALSVPRSVEMVVAVLAVAKAGAAYVPVDPDYPADRVRHMLIDSRPELLLTTSEAAPRLPGPAGLETVRLDEPATLARLAELPEHDVTDAERLAALHPEHPAYVIYTSGSTGAPKGVIVSYRALRNHLAWAARRFPGLAGHTLMHSSISFDFSVTPLLGTLTTGGVLELCADSPDAIAEAAGAASFLKITPSHLALLPAVRFADSGPCTLVIAGEELRGEALDQWHRPSDGRISVINEYGPTEATVGCLLHPVQTGPGQPAVHGAIPVGLPVDNTTCHLLDDDLRLVPVGVAGELYVGGVQLARGYLRRPELTAARFVADPFGAPGERLYRTGDLMRRLPSGALQFLGRIDDQVKIRGFRVELGEIESVLLAFPGVAQATVAARTDGPGGRYLAGYLVPVSGADLDLAAVRAHVAAALPEHMVPATLSVLATLPLSPSGKVDRRALPAPQFGAAPAGQPAGREPANEAEATLAALFVEILGVPTVRLDESFFELGGDSIVAIRLVSRARRAGLRFTPREVFAHRTVQALAAVATVVATEPAAAALGDPGGVGPVELTPIMRAFAERGPLSDQHRMSVLVEIPADLTGPAGSGSPAGSAGSAGLDAEGLERAVQAVLDRHDALRARLDRGGERATLTFEPVGSVRAASAIRRVVTAGPITEDLVAAERAAAAARLAPADGRVFQVVWFDAGQAQQSRSRSRSRSQSRGRGRGRASAVLMVAHHLVVDGVSWRILVEDLAAAWQAASAGREPALPPVSTSFRTWAGGLAGAAAARSSELPTWTALLDGPDPLLGRRRADAARDTWSTVRTLTVALAPDIAEPVLTSVPAAFFAGVDDVLLAGLALALGSWTAARREPARSTLVLLEGHGRQEAAVAGSDLSRTVGWFTSQHPVRLDTTGIDLDDALAGGSGAGVIVKRVKEHLRSLPDHGIGFGMLRHLHPASAGGLATLPVPQIGFNYLGRFDVPGIAGWRVAADGLDAAYGPDMPLPAGLVVNAITEDTPAGPRLAAHWMYADGLFDTASVADLADRWRRALQAIVRHAAGDGAGGRTPSDLSLVSLNQNQLDALEAKWRKA
ncbi:non-ribosomal peptide synthetase [Frankia gtarii]|uniref:non-ribosomal peptide synthetase n=1 Tax=Frankia gtarii TaxID=2950102 RepID=UPI0021BFC78A|nr:non-ribosomal peptide synthetase [Frankia gtarii]